MLECLCAKFATLEISFQILRCNTSKIRACIKVISNYAKESSSDANEICRFCTEIDCSSRPAVHHELYDILHILTRLIQASNNRVYKSFLKASHF